MKLRHIHCVLFVCIGLVSVADGGKKKAPSASNRLRSWGLRHPYDRLLYRAVVFEDPQFWRIITKDFVWLQERTAPRPFTVTHVTVADTTPGGSGATVRLIEGGPFYRHVKLNFISQRGKGYNFLIDIFGV